MRKIVVPVAALIAVPWGQAMACSCVPHAYTPEEAFKVTDVYVEGVVLNPESFASGYPPSDGEKVRLKVTKGLKGASTGEVIEYPFQRSSCVMTQVPRHGETLTFRGSFGDGGISETACFGSITRDGSLDFSFDNGPDSPHAQYMRLLEAYPALREERLRKAKATTDPAARIAIARAFVDDRDAAGANEVLSGLPAEDPAVAILKARSALTRGAPFAALLPLVAIEHPDPRVLILRNSAAFMNRSRVAQRAGSPEPVDASGMPMDGADFGILGTVGGSVSNLAAPGSVWRGFAATWRFGTPPFAFSASDLSGSDLDGVRLVRVTFDATKLAGARMRGASLVEAKFHGVEADGIDAVGADLSRSRWSASTLGRANLSKAVLTGASLVGASFPGSDLSGAKLDGADLRGADLTGAKVDGATFRGAQVDCATKLPPDPEGSLVVSTKGDCDGRFPFDVRKRAFASLNANGEQRRGIPKELLARFTDPTPLWDGDDMAGADLSGFDFTGRTIGTAKLSRANLDGVILDGARLMGTRLDGARLRGASGSVTMAGVDLRGSSLSAPKPVPVTGAATDAPRKPQPGLTLKIQGKTAFAGATLSGLTVSSHTFDRAETTAIVRDLAGAKLADVRFTCSGRFDDDHIDIPNVRSARVSSSGKTVPVTPELRAELDALARAGATIDASCDQSARSTIEVVPR